MLGTNFQVLILSELPNDYEFLTAKGMPIRVFRYIEEDELIRIEAGFRNRQIKIVVNENGKFKYV